MPQEEEKKKVFSLLNQKKAGAAVKGIGDRKVMKWLHPQAVQPGWHFPQFNGLLCCNGKRAF